MVTQRGFIRGDKIHKVLEDLSDEYVFKKDIGGYYIIYNRTFRPRRFTGHLVFKSVRPDTDTYSVRELTNNDSFIHRLDEAIKRHGGGIEVKELFSPLFKEECRYLGNVLRLVKTYDEQKNPRWDSEAQDFIDGHKGKACVLHKGQFHGLYGL